MSIPNSSQTKVRRAKQASELITMIMPPMMQTQILRQFLERITNRDITSHAPAGYVSMLSSPRQRWTSPRH
jgi:hypothetical protein